MASPKMLDEFGDLVRRLVGAGMSEDAAITAARAAQNAPTAAPRQLELPIGGNAWDSVSPLPRQSMDVATAARAMDAGAPAAPDFELGSPLWGQMNKSAGAFDNLRKGRTANLRNQNPDLVRIAQDNIQQANAAARPRPTSGAGEMLTDAALVAGGIGAAGLVADTASNLLPDYSPVAESAPRPAPSTPADLAEESRPVPRVAATDEDGVPTDEAQFTEMFKRQYQAREDKRKAQGKGGYASPSDKAKGTLDDLNARRRKAGGEVPEAKQMMAEADRLLAEGNAQRNAPGYKPAPMSNPREQAQALLQKLNADRMEAGGEVPHSQQVLAEVRRLQALADSQRWGG